jgi:hypothetical protein
MFQEVLVIAFDVIETLVGAPGLAAFQGRFRDAFSNIQQIAQFQSLLQIGIEDIALVMHFDAIESPTKLRNFLASGARAIFFAIDSCAFFQRSPHFPPDSGYGFVAAALQQEFTYSPNDMLGLVR